MSKPEMIVSCYFSEDGDAVPQMLFRSFSFFIQQELGRAGQKFAISAQDHV